MVWAAELRALGDSRSPLYFLILSTIINVFLDIILVYVFRLGIRGAALATVISQFFAAACCGVYAYRVNPYLRIGKKDMVITARMSLQIIQLGIPLSLQFALIAISSMAVQRIVNSYGTIVVAAFTATNRIEQFIHQPYATLGTSLATFCGQNYGASKYGRVYTGYKKGVMIMSILSSGMIIIMQFFGGNITGLFVSDPQVISLGKAGLQMTSLFYLALGMIYVVRGVLTGMGDGIFALLNGVVEVTGRFTIPIFMTKHLGLGAAGIWLSTGIVWVLSGSTAWFRFFTHFQHQKGTAVSRS